MTTVTLEAAAKGARRCWMLDAGSIGVGASIPTLQAIVVAFDNSMVQPHPRSITSGDALT
jgi:hypothetical protein